MPNNRVETATPHAAPANPAQVQPLANLRRDVDDWPPESTDGAAEPLAQALGWFSIGLGLVEVVATHGLARAIGLPRRQAALLPLMGIREIATGIGILSQHQPKNWMWGRVAGDVLDLALLGSALGSDDADHERLAMAAAAVTGVTALDVICARQSGRNGD